MSILKLAKGQQVRNSVINQFNHMVDIYLKTYPVSAIEFERSFKVTGKTYIKAWIGVWYLFFLRIPANRTYFFENFRYQEIINIFETGEVGILGGREDRDKCREKGLFFLWTGGIVAAILVGAKKKHSLPLLLQIQVLKMRLRKRKRFFFLFEDTVPVGSFFALFGNAFMHPSVFIQHGIAVKGGILADGQLARYDLLYSIEQQYNINNNDCVSFELGPPYDVNYAETISKEVVLVSSGSKGYWPELYFKQMDLFRSMEQLLSGAGWNVVYRPHPDEDPIDFQSKFKNVDRRNKVHLLSDSFKVFIGYNSTLLFEAQTYGHVLVCLNDPQMFSFPFEADFLIELDELDNINCYVTKAFEKMHTRAIKKLLPLKERFFSIFKEIEAFEAGGKQ